MLAAATVAGAVPLGAATAAHAALAQPTLTTAASASVRVDGQVNDTAMLSGGASPTGTVTFRLFWPTDTACSHTPAFTSTNPVSSNVATSGAFTAQVAGTYRWTAGYSGDANNGAATSACNAANETVEVTKAVPILTTAASGAIALGGQLRDSATVTGASDPGGDLIPCAAFTAPGTACADSAPPFPTVSFALYGPDDPTCSRAPVFTSSASVTRPVASSSSTANGSYTSPGYMPSAPGTYQWTAAYAGNLSNAAATSPCNAPNETVLVAPGADIVRPALTAFSMAPTTFRAAGSGASIAATAGAEVSYTLSEPATVRFRVQRPRAGRRVRGRCVAPRRSNRRAARCTRYTSLPGTFTHQGHAGLNTFRFTGRLRGRKLAPGRYRLQAQAADGAGNRSVLRAIRFRIVIR